MKKHEHYLFVVALISRHDLRLIGGAELYRKLPLFDVVGDRKSCARSLGTDAENIGTVLEGDKVTSEPAFVAHSSHCPVVVISDHCIGTRV